MIPYVLPLADLQAELVAVGGKGTSLARLSRAGLPVPGGFHITTAAYRRFIEVNGLQKPVQQALALVDLGQLATQEQAHRLIDQAFSQATIPAELAAGVVEAYAALAGENIAVAVRSSATAEDLPEASFAGQQETYLNIRGEEAVLAAVKKCWASLWTARAIGYRARLNISPEEVALAVVVQQMAPAEAAGILFTANPLNGARGEVLINAAWGLGEAVVGGKVTPDTMVVSKTSGILLRRETAEKRVMTVRTGEGTQEQPVPQDLINAPVLTDAQAQELAQLGNRIEKLYGMPMDIEWALEQGSGFAILQARPITALPEAPVTWTPPSPKGIYMRTSVVDLMPDPLSPLYITLGLPALITEGEPVGSDITRSKAVFEPDYFTTINTYGYMNAYFSPRSWWWILTGMLPAYPRMLRGMISYWREQALPQYRLKVTSIRQNFSRECTARELWQGVQQLTNAVATYIATLMFATMGTSAGSEGLLTKLYDKFARREGDPPAATLLMGWDNIPARAEKSLYDLAMWCRKQPALVEHLITTPSSQLAEEIAAEQGPEGIDHDAWVEFQQCFSRHVDAFGYIVFQLDFYQSLPRDHPALMLETIKMHLRGEGADPHQRQQSSEARRIQTAEIMLQRLKGLKRWAFHKALNWAQSLSQAREDALAEIGLGYPELRLRLRELGIRLVQSGAILAPEDIYFLEKAEVEACVTAFDTGKRLPDLTSQVAERRAFHQRMKSITPPPMVPVKKKLMGMDTSIWLAESESDQASLMLKGVASSAGKVTAPARVLRGPEDFDQMRLGEVLVAPTTTPAWTPLFAMAAAVVTDIGGPLSHGSIVAREYGIPAVMGTGIATRRIQSGQTITVDGTTGVVTLS